MNPSFDNSFNNSNSGGPLPDNMHMPQAPILPTQGDSDIILSNHQPTKKSKKWIFILTPFITIGILAIFIIVFITKNHQQINDSIKQSFNKFANYVLSGQDIDTSINPELDISYDYYLPNQFFSQNTAKTTLDTASALFNDFYDRYSKNKIDDSKLESEIHDTKSLLDFSSVIYDQPKIELSNVLRLYSTSGRDEAINYMDNYYNFSNLQDNTYAQDFLEDYQGWIETAIELLDIYYQNGCASKPAQALACSIAKDSANAQEIQNIKDNLIYYDDSLDDYYDSSSKIILNTFVINARINHLDVSNYIIDVDLDELEKLNLQEENNV